MVSKKKIKFNWRISPFFILLVALMLYFGDWLVLIFQAIAIAAHEFAHALVAKKRGYKLDKLKLAPYGAVLSGETHSLKPKDEILIALAGPAVNLILAALTVAAWWLWPYSYAYTDNFVYINLYMALFNLLPIYPLDGGRVLLGALSVKFKRQKVYKLMRIAGIVASVIFAGLFFTVFYFTFNISLALVAIFFFISTVIPDKAAAYQRLYSMAYRSKKLKKGLIIREIAISSDTKLLNLFSMLNSNYFYRFTILDKNFKTLATITELELEEMGIKQGLNKSIGEVL